MEPANRSRIDAKSPRHIDQGLAISQPLQRFLAPGLWSDVDVVFRVDADITIADIILYVALDFGGGVGQALDESRATSDAIGRSVGSLAETDVELIVVHVSSPDAVPRFSEQPQHETETWSDEFLMRYSPADSMA